MASEAAGEQAVGLDPVTLEEDEPLPVAQPQDALDLVRDARRERQQSRPATVAGGTKKRWTVPLMWAAQRGG